MGRQGEPSSRDKILEVAEALFAQRGFAGVGMRQVAQSVGLGKSSLFHHFPTKMQLYLEVLLGVLDRIGAHVDPVLASPRRADHKLRAWVEALIDSLAESQPAARLLLRGLFEDNDFPEQVTPAHDAVDRTLLSLVESFQTIVKAGIDEGVFRPVSLHDATQTMIGATVYHFASGEFGEGVIGGSLFSAEAVARRKREVTEFLLHGLASNGAEPNDQNEQND